MDYALQYHAITIAYCPNIDDLARTMREVKPTIIVAVPRVYEKVYNQVQHKMHGVKGALFKWALSVGAANRETILRGETPTSLSWKLANALVFSKVREGLGGRARIFVSGGAPLGREIATWYADIGIRIHEGYGLTETSPVIARQQSHLPSPRRGRQAGIECGDQDRARRRIAGARTVRFQGLLEDAGRNRQTRLKMAGSRPATSPPSMQTASSPSPIARRT